MFHVFVPWTSICINTNILWLLLYYITGLFSNHQPRLRFRFHFFFVICMKIPHQTPFSDFVKTKETNHEKKRIKVYTNKTATKSGDYCWKSAKGWSKLRQNTLSRINIKHGDDDIICTIYYIYIIIFCYSYF